MSDLLPMFSDDSIFGVNLLIPSGLTDAPVPARPSTTSMACAPHSRMEDSEHDVREPSRGSSAGRQLRIR